MSRWGRGGVGKVGEKEHSWQGVQAHGACAAQELGESLDSGPQGDAGDGLGTLFSLWWALPDPELPWPWTVNPLPTAFHPVLVQLWIKTWLHTFPASPLHLQQHPSREGSSIGVLRLRVRSLKPRWGPFSGRGLGCESYTPDLPLRKTRQPCRKVHEVWQEHRSLCIWFFNGGKEVRGGNQKACKFEKNQDVAADLIICSRADCPK